MISPSSLSAFSTANGVGAPQPRTPARSPGVQQARAQPSAPPPAALQARPGAVPQPGQNLPRGSLLDLSV
jgi:hypothetical protein